MAKPHRVVSKPGRKAKREAWVNEFAKAIEQSDNGARVNFRADVDPAQVRAAYSGSTRDRLRRIKAKPDQGQI
jgi:hypothetical protein